MSSRVTKSAELLAKTFSTKPFVPISSWPEDFGPVNLEEGYQIQNELHSLLGKRQKGWKVVDTHISRV